MFCFPQVWIFYPALFYGLAYLLGTSFALSKAWWLAFPAAFLWLPFLLKKEGRRDYLRLLLSLCASLMAFLVVEMRYDHPKIPLKGIYGDALLEIHNLTINTRHYGKFWNYRATIKFFRSDGVDIGRNIPVLFSVQVKKDLEHPPATGSYWVYGRLRQSLRGNYSFSAHQDVPWKRVSGSWSLAEGRYLSKKWVQNYIHRSIKKERSSKFLTGLATGEFDDRMMAFEFSRFGLQHLMAISGFHFGIIAYFLSLIVRCAVPIRWVPWALMVGLSAYFIFLGISASVMRSWIAAMVFFGSQLVERESNGLNALGVGMLVVLAIDPLACKQLGFQFSFSTTGAILIFYAPALRMYELLWPKRELSVLCMMSSLDQHGYLILNFVRQGLALTTAVSIIAIPMTLYYFLKFPWMSLIYNLFFPFMVSISMLLLMVSMAIGVIPFVGGWIHACNASYTEFVLDFTYCIPTNFDVIFYSDFWTEELIVIYVSLVFFSGLVYRHWKKDIIEWSHPLP